jgi:hypothetical protein
MWYPISRQNPNESQLAKGVELRWMVTVYAKKMIKDHEAFQAMHSADQRNLSQLNASSTFAVQCQVTSGVTLLQVELQTNCIALSRSPWGL